MTKLRLLLTSLVIIIFISAEAQTSISMGPSYANDIYYSMENGVVSTVDRAEWDLGFYTSPWSAGILTNDGAGVELVLYPHGDTTAWMSVDTNGISTWPVLYNGVDSWENGAFNRHSGNHPDYGWGVYNSISHDVVGDSIYIIKLQDGSYKKLWIVKKISNNNIYVFRYANIDNSSETEQTIDNNEYMNVNFSYFSFSSESFLNREPNADSWDILFTKYQALQPQGSYYSVVGVFNNLPVSGNRYYPVTIDYAEWDAQQMDTVKSVVGYDWKWFDLTGFQWNVQDSLVFFLNPSDDNIYKMRFTYYGGTSNGDIEFNQEVISAMQVDEFGINDAHIHLSPNPATDKLNINWTDMPGDELEIQIVDIQGRTHLQTKVNAADQNACKIDVSKLKSGLYIVSLISGTQIFNEKIMVE